jgi:dihydroorotase
MILIRGARVWGGRGLIEADVLIDGDRVAEVGDPQTQPGTRVIEASGAILGPGLVDLHVHLREPGQTWKEDITSGSMAAVAGGFTALVAMPNTDPPIDNAKTVTEILEIGAGVGLLDIVAAGSLTRGREGLEMSDLDAMHAAGVRIFTDDGDAVADSGLLRRIMTYLRDLPGAVVAEHAEDVTLTRGGHLNEGMVSVSRGIGGLPGVAEEVVVARDLALAEDTGAWIHIQHVSTERSANLVRRAKERGVAVTCEVTPHHLVLDESSVAGLDPHTVSEKDVPFEEAPRGVIGLETSASVAWTALKGDADRFFERMSVGPSKIAGLERHGGPVEPGSVANLVLFDPAQTWQPGAFVSKSANSPFVGAKLTGKVIATIHDGAVVFEGIRDD